jgi:hypothetical protein
LPSETRLIVVVIQTPEDTNLCIENPLLSNAMELKTNMTYCCFFQKNSYPISKVTNGISEMVGKFLYKYFLGFENNF